MARDFTHGTQQLPDTPHQTPTETYTTATRQKNQRTRTKMGHIYIPQPNDPQDNQPLQKHQHTHSIPEHKQDNTTPGTTQTTR